MPSETFGPDALEIQEQLGRIAMQPAIQRQHEAQARHFSSQADLTEQQAAVQKRMAAELQNASTGDTESLNPVWRIADIAMRAGHPDAYKIANTASQIDYRAEAAMTQQARAQLIQRRTQLNNLNLADHLLSGVTDEAGLKQAVQTYESQTGDKSGLLDEQGNLTRPYSEGLVRQMRMKALTMKDQLTLQQRKEDAASADRERKSKQSARLFWQNFENQQKRSAAQARGRQAKTGSDPLIPLERVIKAGADYIASIYDTDERDPESRVKGRQLMEIATEMKKKNAALSTEDAMSQSLKVMQERGDFVGKKLKPTPSKPSSAQSLPSSGSTSDLKINQYYTDGKEVRQWLGPEKKWGPAVRASGAAVSADLLDDTEEDRTALEDDGEED